MLQRGLLIGILLLSVVPAAHANIVRVGNYVGATNIKITTFSPEDAMVAAGIPKQCRMEAHEMLQNRIAYIYDTDPKNKPRLDILCEFIPTAAQKGRSGVPDIGVRGKIGGLKYIRFRSKSRSFDTYIFDRTATRANKEQAYGYQNPFFIMAAVNHSPAITPLSALNNSGATTLNAVSRSPLLGSGIRISSRVQTNRVNPYSGITRDHKGTDYAASCGTPITAGADGVVGSKGFQAGGAGYYITLRHDRGTTSIDETKYFHMKGPSTTSGRVRQGQVIGYVGSTGGSTGCHLHYEVYRGNQPLDAVTLQAPAYQGTPLTAEEALAFQGQVMETDEGIRIINSATLAGKINQNAQCPWAAASCYPILKQGNEGDV